MSRSRITPEGHERILDAWDRPESAGDAIGCIATTFTFDADFFERDCLARFLAFERDPDEDGQLYLVERDERLAALSCSGVLADGRHCGQPRSLRWDIVPARPRGGIMHAKITLLSWRHHLRLIVASANLTPDGYRRNREGLMRLEYSADRPGPRGAGAALLSYLDVLISACATDGPATRRMRGLIERAQRQLGNWASDDRPSGIDVHAVLIGPGRPDLITQVAAAIPTDRPAREAEIVSPFYDRGDDNPPAQKAWSLLAKRGEVKLSYIAVGQQDRSTGKTIVNAPESLSSLPAGRDSASIMIRIADEDTPDPGSDISGIRPLHLKSLRLKSGGWTAWLIGSSNWTSRGTGVAGYPNWEANLLVVADERADDQRRALTTAVVPSIACDPARIDWHSTVSEDEGDGQPLLPRGFGDAVLTSEAAHAYALRLTFVPAELPAMWTLRNPADGTTIVDSTAWRAVSGPSEWTVPWHSVTPPSGLIVEWPECTKSAWWPVIAESSAVLPLPEGLRDLTLEALVLALTSARSTHQALARWLRRREGRTNSKTPKSYDPHAAVDTSGYLLQRMRVVSMALTGLRRRLERPAATREALDWRLDGPLGIDALVNAMRRGARTPAEAAFFTIELAFELRRMRPLHEEGCVSAASVRKRITAIAERLESSISTSDLASLPGLQRYAGTGLEDLRA